MEDIDKLWGEVVRAATKKYGKNQGLDDNDLRQDCYLEIISSYDSILKVIDERGMVGAKKYVALLCRNVVSNKVDYERVRTNGRVGWDRLRLEESPAVNTVDKEDLVQKMDKAIQKLPRSEQFIVRSLYYGTATEDALAQDLGKTVHWVRTKNQLCLAKLKVLLEK